MDLVVGCTTRPYSSLSLAEACRRIASAGYTDVAIFANEGRVAVRSDSPAEEVTGARKIVADAGLRPSMLIGRTNLDLGLEAAVEEYGRLISNAAELGTKWLLDCGTGKEEHYDDYYELMRRVMPQAEERGIDVVLKPHGGITLTADDLLRAHRRVGHPSFGICHDPGNIIYYSRGELRPETDVERVAPAVSACIIKDCVVVDGKPDVMVTPGEGLVDFEAFLGGLVRNGFRGPLYVECVGGRELDEIDANVRRTLDFIRGILDGL
jgi:sugar phosphate isomerase/epimerase